MPAVKPTGGKSYVHVTVKDSADRQTIPGARVRLVKDGKVFAEYVSNSKGRAVFWHLPKLYTGGIKGIRQVSIETGKRVTATADQRVLLDVDGEQPGTLPAELAIVPGILKMIMQRPA